jgi:hypothetical protein
VILAGYRSGHRAWLGATAMLLFAGVAESAGPPAGDVAVAESLFREGKERMASRDYAHACPKLADSFRLDPATGTLLALAMCHERANKLASAWAEYADAAARAKREVRVDREKAAREKVAALEARLSYLTISTSRAVSDTPGVEITRNGVSVGTGTLGTAVPVDGGTYTIAASAPGKKPWSAQVTVAPSGERHTLSIPALEENAPAGPATAAAKSLPAAEKATAALAMVPVANGETRNAPEKPEAPKGESGYGVFGAASIAAGLTSVGIGTAYMLRAMAKNEDSKPGCDGDRCTPAATQDRLDARAFGNVATIGFLAGGAVIALGTTLYIVGAPPAAAVRTSSPTPNSATLAASPWAGPSGAGGVLQGTF